MNDPYVLDNGVLKNKLGITDVDELRKAEADIGFLKLINVDSIGGRIDEKLMKNLHRHIFVDIFDWAGEFRTVPLVKEEVVLPGYSIPYTDSKHIKKELTDRLKKMELVNWSELDISELSRRFAREIALLWKVHPFRDGNTRTTLSFAYIFAKEHGFPFDIETFTQELNREYDDSGKITKFNVRDKFVLACLDEKDYPEVGHLASVFYQAIVNYQDKHNQTAKSVL